MNEILVAFRRGEDALASAKRLIDIDLLASAGRVYISGENLAVSLLLALSGSYPKDHGKTSFTDLI